MRDQRMEEILEGRMVPKIGDLPLLNRIIEKESRWYNPTELQVLRSYVTGLKKDFEELAESFAAIEKQDLKPSTIICTVCGNVFSVNDKETSPCEHLKQLAKECLEGCED